MHLLGGLLEAGAAELAVEFNGFPAVGGGQPLQQRVQIGSTSDIAALPALEPVDDQIADDPPQPAAKRASLRRRVPTVDAPADRQEQFLHDVAGVHVLQAVLPQQAVKHWLVKRHKFRPGLVILCVTEAKQQACAGCRSGDHRSFPI